MTASQEHISATTPIGATLVADGATFRLWAPGAERVHVVLGDAVGQQPADAEELVKDPGSGHWS